MHHPSIRQFQKSLTYLKVGLVVASLLILVGLVAFVSPNILFISLFSLVLLTGLTSGLSIFLKFDYSFLISIAIVFPLFIKALDVFSVANMILFLVFLSLLFWQIRANHRKSLANDVK